MSRLKVRPLTRETVEALIRRLGSPDDNGKQLVRRSERRTLLPGSVTIHLFGNGWQRSVEAFCRDMSAHGVGVFVRKALPVDCTVRIDLNLPDEIHTTRALVARCRRVPGGYHVGFRFLFPRAQSRHAPQTAACSVPQAALVRPRPGRREAG